MSGISLQVALLLAEQKKDRGRLDLMLEGADEALARGDLALAKEYGEGADGILARIRRRSSALADLVETAVMA